MDTSELRKLYEYERQNLYSLCEKWQKILDNGSRRSQSEDTKGAILAVLGQTRLLLNKKFKQFEQMLADPVGRVGDMPPITLSDLEGFWEVVMIQGLPSTEASFCVGNPMKFEGAKGVGLHVPQRVQDPESLQQTNPRDLPTFIESKEDTDF